MKVVFKVLSAVAFVIFAAWAWNSPGFESIGCAVTALATLIGLFVTDGNSKPPTMSQRGGKKARMYQSVGPMNINTKSAPDER